MASFKRAALAALTVLLLATAPAGAAGRPVRAEDLFKISYAGNPQISPDGKLVVFVVSKMNGPQDRYDTNLWMADVASGRVRQLTHTGRDNSPAWAPGSGAFAFVRSEPKRKPQIFEYNVRTGRIRKLTNVKTGASAPAYSNHGALIAFSSTVTDEPGAAEIDFARAGFTPKKAQRRSDVRQIDTMHFQANGAGEVDKYHQHIWVMNADGTKPRALTSGHEWSEGGYAFSPDDKTIAFNSLRRAIRSPGRPTSTRFRSTGAPCIKRQPPRCRAISSDSDANKTACGTFRAAFRIPRNSRRSFRPIPMVRRSVKP